jgi:putative transposase
VDLIAGKKIKGRKRHILVDTLGLLLGCHITTANISDKQGARETLNMFYIPCVQKLWADQGYDGLPLHIFCKDKGIELELVKRKEAGFKILPKRWIVERTFSWISRYRRLSKDYEGVLATSQNWCYLSMIRLMISRIEFSNFRF